MLTWREVGESRKINPIVGIYTPKTNMDTQNSHLWKEVITCLKKTSCLVSMLVFGGVWEMISMIIWGLPAIYTNYWDFATPFLVVPPPPVPPRRPRKRATMRPCNKIHGRTWCFVPIWGGEGPEPLTSDAEYKMGPISSLKLTYHLKTHGWNTSFLLGWPIFRCYVSFGEGNPKKSPQ